MERNTTTNTFRLGSIFGVTIAVHFTWFVIFALITLFIFGGVSEIGKEADRPGEEIRIALIGPVSSYFLAAVFGDEE